MAAEELRNRLTRQRQDRRGNQIETAVGLEHALHIRSTAPPRQQIGQQALRRRSRNHLAAQIEKRGWQRRRTAKLGKALDNACGRNRDEELSDRRVLEPHRKQADELIFAIAVLPEADTRASPSGVGRGIARPDGRGRDRGARGVRINRQAELVEDSNAADASLGLQTLLQRFQKPFHGIAIRGPQG